jgi:hypothetical protein
MVGAWQGRPAERGGIAMRIWKYGIPIQGEPIEVSMPIGAVTLHLAIQHGEPRLWVKTRPHGPSVIRRFRWIGTGHDFDEGDVIDHVGTIQTDDGRHVWHLFEVH